MKVLLHLQFMILRPVKLPRFVQDVTRYRSQQNGRFPFHWKYARPILDERYLHAGTAEGEYFHQDLWAARAIFRANPARHVDIGSRIDGFVAHLLVFRDVEVVDIRALESGVSGLRFTQDDATQLRQFGDDSLDSISSLHAAEHFGLGRYGDAIDADGWLKFVHALTRVLRPNGHLYFSVPCGQERVHFNAHRVFSPHTVLDAFSACDWSRSTALPTTAISTSICPSRNWPDNDAVAVCFYSQNSGIPLAICSTVEREKNIVQVL